MANLTTLTKAKNYLGISGTDEDTLLNELISGASKAIENFCNRIFGEAPYTEYHDGRGRPSVVLKQLPVVSVTSVHDDIDRDFEAGDLVDADNYIVDMVAGIIILKNDATFADGVLNVKVVYTAGYSTIPEAADLGCQIWVAAFYNRLKDGADGFTSENIGGIAQAFLNIPMPENVKALILPYREIPI